MHFLVREREVCEYKNNSLIFIDFTKEGNIYIYTQELEKIKETKLKSN